MTIPSRKIVQLMQQPKHTPDWKNALLAVLQLLLVSIGFTLVIAGGVYVAAEAARWAEARGYIGSN